MKIQTILNEYGERRLEHITRRHFLRNCTTGLGAIWLATHGLSAVSTSEGPEHKSSNPLSPLWPHHPARAKRVIYLHMVGAPSQLELFDYRPELKKFDGKDCPAESDRATPVL